MIDIDIHTISQEDLNNYELVDIREQDEIDIWPPLKKCRHVPFSKFPDNKTQFDKDKSYLLFCAKGGRSHFMAEALAQEGYKVLSVNNGIASVNSYLKKLES
jgi:rhodanese-related sulfurtransferase